MDMMPDCRRADDNLLTGPSLSLPPELLPPSTIGGRSVPACLKQVQGAKTEAGDSHVKRRPFPQALYGAHRAAALKNKPMRAA